MASDNDEYIPFNCKNAYLYDASELILYGNDTASPCFNKSDQCEHGDQCPHHIELPPDHLARALYRAEEIAHSGDGYRLQLTRDRELICLAPKHSNSMQRQFGGYVSIPLPIPIKELEQEFIALLSCKTETWVWAGAGWWGMSGERGYVWCECPECHKVGITYRGNVNELPCYKRDYHWGLELEHSKSRHNTPRLLAAYTAARQERFGK